MSQPWIVMMPEGWKPGTCVCDKCFGNCVRTDDCPLDNAKKAVECGYTDSLGAHMIATPKGKALSLYAVEMEEK